MNILYNIHTVPITDLFTFSVAAIFLITYVANQVYNVDRKTSIELLFILLILNIVIHPLFGIPNNLSRFFGLGKKPDNWKGM
jgi:hypothetical protein